MTITFFALWFGFNIAVVVLRLRVAGYFRAARRTPVDCVKPALKLVQGGKLEAAHRRLAVRS